jgi:hypothetical protein
MAFFKKSNEENVEDINLEDIGSGDILRIMLKRLINDGKYNEAENMLFQEIDKYEVIDKYEEIDKNKSQVIYEIAISFYDTLLKKSDEELEKENFSREEIYQGMQDVKNIFEKIS